MSNNISGVKVHGKTGRRIRPKERLEVKFNKLETSYNAHMKMKPKDRPHTDEYYSIVDYDLRRMSKELETLKSRI